MQYTVEFRRSWMSVQRGIVVLILFEGCTRPIYFDISPKASLNHKSTIA